MKTKIKVKVAIAVVYLVPEDDNFILDTHLTCLEQYTSDVDFTIYAATDILNEKSVLKLHGIEYVKICNFPKTDQTMSVQHSYYLDLLVKMAVEDGADYICTFDVDSFPISNNWFQKIRSQMEREGTTLCAVLRKENFDTVLPHPSCIVFERAFYEKYRPTFFPTQAALDQPDYHAFFQETGQRLDTGIGYGFVLHRNAIPWTRLTRSNALDEHPLMAGIYGDLIFHLGAFSRGKMFNVDAIAHLRRHGTYPTLEDENAIMARNGAIFDRICAAMRHDRSGYIRYLQGKGPHPLAATFPPSHSLESTP